MRRLGLLLGLALASLAASAQAAVPVKDLGRFLGWRENALVGYGLVIGLGGSGDSPRNEATRRALSNVMGRLGAAVAPDELQSRNVATVMVTANLPPSANRGDRIDVIVSSIGDARSLVGGALLMTPLLGPDQRPYALAQGPVVVGGYRFDSSQNVQQKNYPASGILPGGATIEASVEADLAPDGELIFILDDPDNTTAIRIADSVNGELGYPAAEVRGADKVAIRAPTRGTALYRLIAQIENVRVEPQAVARVVVNERSGTIVAGGGVQISSVVVSQGDVRVSVTTDHQASQPTAYGGYLPEARSLVVTNTKLEVASADQDALVRLPNTTIADLVEALRRVHVDTRGIIGVLQAMKSAGALHADIIVQ